MSSKKILLCEDHQIVIDGLLLIFKNQPDYSVVDFVKDGENVLEKTKIHLPDIILLDLNLPSIDGLSLLKEIRLSFPNIKVIVLTMYSKQSIVDEVVKNGGHGFLLKNCSTDELLSALDSVTTNSHFYKGVGVGVKSSDIENDKFYKKVQITRREKEIIFELIQGLSVPKISEKLFISAHTVETHKKNIFKKLDIHNTIDLVKFANDSDLFS